MMFWLGVLIGFVIGKPSNNGVTSSNTAPNLLGIQNSLDPQNFQANMAAQMQNFNQQMLPKESEK